ncbi:hypothetical protein STEG23_029156, partial [Scotinomys teguina]
LTWVFVLSGSWKWLQKKAISSDILWMSHLPPCGIWEWLFPSEDLCLVGEHVSQ